MGTVTGYAWPARSNSQGVDTMFCIDFGAIADSSTSSEGVRRATRRNNFGCRSRRARSQPSADRSPRVASGRASDAEESPEHATP